MSIGLRIWRVQASAAFIWISLWLSVALASDGRMEPDPVFGGEVYVREAGERANPTLVLIHGLGEAASDDWRDTIENLQSDYHILTFDLPGFGRSSKANTVYTPTRYAELIHHLTRRFANHPFHLAGHSMGGAIALRYAATYQEDLRSLILADAAGILHRLAYTKYLAPLGLEQFAGMQLPGRLEISDWAGVLLGSLERTLPLDLNIVLYSEVLRENLLQANPEVIAGLGLVLEDFSLAPAQVKVPTLILWGEEDQVAPPRTGRVLRALIPNAVLHLIPNAGHVPIREEFEQYLELVKHHLNAPGEIGGSVSSEAAVIGTRGRVICDKQWGQTYTGKIDRLELKDCRDVLIHNAEIENLVIERSQAVIVDSHLHDKNNALFASESTVVITAGSIESDVAIKSVSSRFDIAGTRLIGHRYAVHAVGESDFIMSLVAVQSAEKPMTMLHGPQPLQYRFTL